MKYLATLMLLASTTAHAADGVSFEVQNFTAESGISTIVLAVTNNRTDPVKSVFMSCAFLNADMKAIDVGRGLIDRLAAGETAYEKVQVPTTKGVENAQCRIDKYRD